MIQLETRVFHIIAVCVEVDHAQMINIQMQHLDENYKKHNTYKLSCGDKLTVKI